MDSPAVSTILPTRLDRGSYLGHVALLERDDLLGTLQGLHEEAIAGSGRLALVHGEAGVGKSALVREWGALAATHSPVLRGACDPLSSPVRSVRSSTSRRTSTRRSTSSCARASGTGCSRRRWPRSKR